MNEKQWTLVCSQNLFFSNINNRRRKKNIKRFFPQLQWQKSKRDRRKKNKKQKSHFMTHHPFCCSRVFYSFLLLKHSQHHQHHQYHLARHIHTLFDINIVGILCVRYQDFSKIILLHSFFSLCIQPSIYILVVWKQKRICNKKRLVRKFFWFLYQKNFFFFFFCTDSIGDFFSNDFRIWNSIELYSML